MGAKHKKTGDTWEQTFHKTTYLMEKQPDGRAKAIKRITPYKMPQKANSLSDIQATKKPENFKPRNTGKIVDKDYDNLDRLRGSRTIYIRENSDTRPIKTERINSKTIVIKRVA